MEVLIKNGLVIDSSSKFLGDIYIKDGKIKEIGEDLQKECNIINAKGLAVMPAFIDLHVHFRDPGFTHKEDIETGSKAAVKGGYTTVVLMGNTSPVCSDMETVNYVREKVKKVGLIDAEQVVTITKNFSGNDISHLDFIDDKVKFISEDGKDVMNTKVMIDAMEKAKKKGITVMCHSEDCTLSNVDMRLAENTMTWRNITLSQYTGCRVHLSHVSTKEAMQYIIEAKNKGINVTCEVAPHHLTLTTSECNYRVNPPIRQYEDVSVLIKAIKDGYVDAIATDHAPHTDEDKENGCPGMVGLETAFSLCYTKLVKQGHISINKLSEVMSKRPAEIMKIKKGMIIPGYEADLVLIDLEKEYVIDKRKFYSKSSNTPFHGKEVFGEVIATIKAGKVVYKKDELEA